MVDSETCISWVGLTIIQTGMFPSDGQDWLIAAVCFIAVFYEFSFFGTASDSTRRVYALLQEKIPGAPPAWMFGVVWPILYTLMALGLWLVWRDDTFQADHTQAYNWFMLLALVNIPLNKVWTGLFSVQFRFGVALADLMLVLGTAVGTTAIAIHHDKTYPALFWGVYSLWLLYAAYLNWSSLSYQACVTEVLGRRAAEAEERINCYVNERRRRCVQP